MVPLPSTGEVSIPETRTVQLPALVHGRSPKEARALIANLKASLEERLMDEPGDYDALVLLGELNLRVGLCKQAQVLLYQATLLPPPSWEAYQRTSYLLRRAEEQQQRAFDRLPGAPPPTFMLKAAGWLAGTVHRLATRGARA